MENHQPHLSEETDSIKKNPVSCHDTLLSLQLVVLLPTCLYCVCVCVRVRVCVFSLLFLMVCVCENVCFSFSPQPHAYSCREVCVFFVCFLFLHMNYSFIHSPVNHFSHSGFPCVHFCLFVWTVSLELLNHLQPDFLCWCIKMSWSVVQKANIA